jgi:hydroxymethylglutaryl-CoA lyase
MLPKNVTLFEMGPRDGLQNESQTIPADAKVRFIEMLSESGLKWIEATSFVSPKAIPQLGDAVEVFGRIKKTPGVRYPVLTPNLKGYADARAAGADAIAVFSAASNEFTRRNINMTVEESLATFRQVVRAAKDDGVWVRGYVSTAFGSPFGDEVTPQSVVDVAVELMDMGCDGVSIGDTIGVGVPSQVEQLFPLLVNEIPLDRIAFHFHDTRGTALANIYAALRLGAHTFDSSAGGLGGCPYAPGATGNIGTEDVLYMLDHMGVNTGVDIDKVRAASRYIATVLDHPLTSRTYQALEAGDKRAASVVTA